MDSKQLRDALQQVKTRTINRSLPITTHAKIDFGDGLATVTGTNLEIATVVKIKCKSDEPFSIITPMRQTETFLHGNDGEVKFENTKNKMTMSRTGLGDFSLLDLPKVEDYPPIPKDDSLKWSNLNGEWLCRMLKIAITGCAKELSRPVLTGIACKDGNIASADGFRLVWIKHANLSFGLDGRQAIIPWGAAEHICKLFSKSKTVDMAFTGNLDRVYAKSGDVQLLAQLVQGTYPQYDRLIPDSYSCKASFSSPLMLQRLNMIDAASLPAGIIRYAFSKDSENGDELCKIQAREEDLNDYNLTCPVKLQADGGKIAFQYKYFIDAIRPFSMVDLEITSPSSPGKFTGDVEGLTIVVMPMFVQW